MNQPQPYKKLYRSRKERMIAGVCGGLAEYLGVDPTWIRLLFILLFFFWRMFISYLHYYVVDYSYIS